MEQAYMDEIALEGLVFFGRHGVNPEETSLGQRFGVDVRLRLDLSKPASTDELADTVSYASVFRLVRAEVEGAPSRLLEHLAARILRAVLMHDPRIHTVRVRVRKLSPPIAGSTSGEACVTLERGREWLGAG